MSCADENLSEVKLSWFTRPKNVFQFYESFNFIKILRIFYDVKIANELFIDILTVLQLVKLRNKI